MAASHSPVCDLYLQAVDFWLTYCVFPTETHQYPQRLVNTAWHLVDSTAVGFSGTNDNHRLLPLSVKQHFLEEPLLKGTNGKMLAIMFKAPYSTLPKVRSCACKSLPLLLFALCFCHPVWTSDPALRTDAAQTADAKPQWQQLLDKAVRENFDALIDCGALLAEISGRCVASFFCMWQSRMSIKAGKIMAGAVFATQPSTLTVNLCLLPLSYPPPSLRILSSSLRPSHIAGRQPSMCGSIWDPLSAMRGCAITIGAGWCMTCMAAASPGMPPPLLSARWVLGQCGSSGWNWLKQCGCCC